MNSGAAEDGSARLAALRERGGAAFDPVRFRFIEALARRSSEQRGAVRELLERRLSSLLTAFAEELECSAADEVPRSDPAASAEASPAAPGPLAGLLAHIAAHAPAEQPQLQALRHFRSTWSRLSADRRLSQSLALLPGNAGPLNSHHLVLRSLRLMREISPDYLNRFMAHVDVLVAAGQIVPVPAAPPRVDGRGRVAHKGNKGGRAKKA